MLDPTIDAVAGFEIGVFEQVLGGNPGISYLKWDANRPITDPGSRSLPADRQANLWVDNVAATWALMDDVVARQPEVELMLCVRRGTQRPRDTTAVPRVLDLRQHRSGRPGADAVGVLALLPGVCHGGTRHALG
ncbi:MAG: alpha-galactosidase [Microthrixaceae bacterium]|nr:alpha-galactosidase [Microthrixaceae bacterium]